MFGSKKRRKRKVSSGSKKRRKCLLEVKEEEEEESPFWKLGERKGREDRQSFWRRQPINLARVEFHAPFSLSSSLTPFQINSRL